MRITPSTLAMALAATLCAATPAAAQGTFHGNLARTGVYDSPGPQTFGGLKWSFHTQGAILASPAVADGVVYMPSTDTNLYAIDQATGKEKWHFKSSMPIASSPAVVGDTLYFVSSGGVLAALDIATGKPRWTLPMEYERRFEAQGIHGLRPNAQTIPDAWDVFMSSPAVANGKVYVGSGDGNIYAADAKTGTLLWKFQTKDVVHSSPAIANGTLYIGSWDSNLYALDAESGLLKWAFKSGEDPVIHNQVGFQSSPAVVDGVVYIGCRDAHVYAIDAASGHKKWDYATSKSWVIGTPAVRDGVVYVGTSDSSRFLALDARNGRLLWEFKSGAYIFSSAALAGDLAYVGSHDGKLYAINSKTGALAWSFQTESSRKNAQGLLTPEGKLNEEAFAPFFHDFQDMYLDLQRFASLGGILSSPVVDHGIVYVGSTDGNLYAIQ